MNILIPFITCSGQLIFLVTLTLFQECSGDSTKTYVIDVNTKTSINSLDERYLSVDLEPSLIKENWRTFDFSSKRLQTLAKGLSPTYGRFGGTSADFLFFDEPPPPGVFRWNKNLGGSDGYWFDEVNKVYTNFTMTKKDWDDLNYFLQSVGWRLLFDVNVMIKNGTAWDPRNAYKLLQYTVNKGYAKNIDFELGNEPNAFYHALNRSIDAKQLAKDFLTLQDMVKSSAFKDVFKDAVFVGPDTTSHKKSGYRYMEKYLRVVKDKIHAVTWHQYYVNGKNATVEEFTDPKVLDEYLYQIQEAQAVLKKRKMETTKLWMGETGSAWGGGAPSLSNSYVAGFLYLDKLGMAAKNGISLVMRQSFYGGNYAMISNHLEPLPDYWLALLYKSIVGNEVLDVSLSSSTNAVRIYAHCTNNNKTSYAQGAVTVYAINLLDKAVNLTFSNELTVSPIHEYLLTPHGEKELISPHVNLNGEKLMLIDDVTFPELKPRLLNAGQSVHLPKKSFAFYAFPTVQAKACS